MRTLGQIPKYNPTGEAKLKEQKRLAQQATEEKNRQLQAFMFRGFGFKPRYGAHTGTLNMDGPLCPREDVNKIPCLSMLSGETDKTRVVCEVCGFSGDLPEPYEKFRQTAHKKFDGRQRYLDSGGKIETLDVPYEAIKKTDQDDTRAIKIKWAQKDGRNMAVIYFIEKDKNGNKTQIMVDMDREEIRYDASDIAPGKVLAEIHAIFPKTEMGIEYKSRVSQEKGGS